MLQGPLRIADNGPPNVNRRIAMMLSTHSPARIALHCAASARCTLRALRCAAALAALCLISSIGPSACAGGEDESAPAAAHDSAGSQDENGPDFRTDVMAVLSKSGCNMGACHGNQNGKGGFRLSLRGQDADFDYRSMTREFASRRIDLFDPDRSLILLKPSGELAHQGGVRFRSGSIEHQILRRWIAAGVQEGTGKRPSLVRLSVEPVEQTLIEPADRIALHAVAHFSDGSERDVTQLACYETSNLVADVSAGGKVERRAFGETSVVVRYLDQQRPVQLAFVPARPDFVWSDPPAENFIDRLIHEKLRSLRINPSPLCDDATFVRRVYLDAIGIPPTANEARRFVADSDPRKRTALIDDLLCRPEFADYWALKWSDILRNEEKVLDSTGVVRFHGWIREAMSQGMPLDRFVRELLVGRGSTYEQPAANFYRANRDPTMRGETASRLFLGFRLQCARCHNHPFDRWTQSDYYSWAAIFARVDYEIVKNEPTDKLDKNEFVGEQIVKIKDEGELTDPRDGSVASPRFLGGPAVELETNADRLPPLAQWLTSPENEAFARAQANFVWYHLMGRGLVEPIDDFRVTNPAVNPPLLDALADEFVAGAFDLRHLIRTIMTSRTYQLSAVPNDTNRDDDANFSRAVVRRLTAEQLLDAQAIALDAWPQFNGYDAGTRAGQLAGVNRVRRRDRSPTGGDRVLMAFGKPERLLACECERSNETSMNHAFLLVSGEDFSARLTESGNRLERLAQSDLSNGEVVDELVWWTLSRPPTDDERTTFVAALDVAQATPQAPGESPADQPTLGDRLPVVQDIAWALLNAKEFIFRK